MGALDDEARKRLKRWHAGSGLTQAAFAEKIGRNAVWVSRYFGNLQDADLDTLQTMATALGHSLTALFDLRPDEREQALLTAYRAIPESHRPMLIRTAEQWAALARTGGRGRSRNLG